MMRFAALAALAALAACGPEPDAYVHGGAVVPYGYSHYDRPYWGPSYYAPRHYAPRHAYPRHYHAPHRRGHAGPPGPPPHVHRGPPPGGPTQQSRQFWGVERPPPRAEHRGPGPGGFWGGQRGGGG